MSDNALADYAGREQLNAIFGDAIVAMRYPDILVQFQYGVSDSDVTTTTSGTGAATMSNSTASISSGAGIGACSIESLDTLRYQPGFDGFGFFTAAFSPHEFGNTFQRIGLFDTNNGFWVGYDPSKTSLVVANRSAGVDNFETVTCKKYWPQYNPENLNIYRINYGWLGIAPIAFEVYAGLVRGWVTVGVIDLLSQQAVPTILQPVQPITAEVGRTGGSGEVVLKTCSWCAGRVGGGQHLPSDRKFATSNSKVVIAQTNLFTIRNKTSFQSLTNRIVSHLDHVSVAVDGTKNAEIKMVKNATIGGTPSFSDYNAGSSTLEIDVAGTTVTGGEDELIFSLAKVDSERSYVFDLGIRLRPGDTLTASAESASSTEALVAVSGHEEF